MVGVDGVSDSRCLSLVCVVDSNMETVTLASKVWIFILNQVMAHDVCCDAIIDMCMNL